MHRTEMFTTLTHAYVNKGNLKLIKTFKMLLLIIVVMVVE